MPCEAHCTPYNARLLLASLPADPCRVSPICVLLSPGCIASAPLGIAVGAIAVAGDNRRARRQARRTVFDTTGGKPDAAEHVVPEQALAAVEPEPVTEPVDEPVTDVDVTEPVLQHDAQDSGDVDSEAVNDTTGGELDVASKDMLYDAHTGRKENKMVKSLSKLAQSFKRKDKLAKTDSNGSAADDTATVKEQQQEPAHHAPPVPPALDLATITQNSPFSNQPQSMDDNRWVCSMT